MIKNIYDRKNKYYNHEYYCDHCFCELVYGEILRHEFAIENNKFDLCSGCEMEFESLMWEEEIKEKK